MLRKKNILIILSFLTFLSIEGWGRSFNGTTISKNNAAPVISQPSQNVDDAESNSITGTIPSLKLTESNPADFQNLKNNKKALLFFFSNRLTPSLPCYKAYCSKRTNNINSSPHYIIFRSLLI
ncbi:MAG: hypothetical protein V4608_08705 [Bacteroidota bacterium]